MHKGQSSKICFMVENEECDKRKAHVDCCKISLNFVYYVKSHNGDTRIKILLKLILVSLNLIKCSPAAMWCSSCNKIFQKQYL